MMGGKGNWELALGIFFAGFLGAASCKLIFSSFLLV
jgi:hypothetical protein